MPLLPVKTRGEGDCAFHAAFGQWNKNVQEFVYHDIQAIRKRVADTVRISIAGQLIFPSIVAAIDELIRSTTRAIDFTGFPIIQALRTQFHTTQSVDLDWTNRSIIEEYANIVATPGVWQLPCELSIIAHACQITVRHFIGNRTNPLQIQEYNPGHPIANLYFNGSNHYEAMRETGPFHSHLSNRMDVDPQPTLSLPQVGAYAASGLKHTLHGNVYQLKLLMLFFYRGCQQGYTFQLATEMDDAEKFDDLVFEYKKPGDQQPSYFFLQAKHKQDDNQLITDTELLDTREGEFSLAKYFISYQKIKQNPTFQNGASRKCYLCTNIGFDRDSVNDEERTLKLIPAFEQITETEEMLDTPSTAKAIKYRFNKAAFPGKALLCGTLQGDQQLILASTLFAIMQKAKGKIEKTHKPFNDKAQYQWLLTNNIIDDKTRRLSDDFIKGQNLTPHAAQFKTLYTQVESTQGATWVDKEVDEFLDHLVFAVNQPNEVRLGEIITEELGEEFNLIDSDFIYAGLQKAVLDWMKQKQGTFLTQVSAKVFRDTMRQKLSRLALIGPTVDYQTKLKEYGIDFTPAVPVQNFLASTNQVLIYQTTGDVFLGSMQIYQTLLSLAGYTANDSYIFVTLKKGLRLKKLLFSAFTHSKLLVIACNTLIENEANKLIQDLSQRISPQQKIILITNSDNAFVQTLPSAFTVDTVNAQSGFATLTPTSQAKVLAHPVNFQGRVLALGELLSDPNSIIDTEVLSEFLSGREIRVGEALESFEAESYYIDRTFYGVQIADTCLQQKTSDIFAVSGMTQHDLNSIAGSSESERYISLNPQYDLWAQFQEICAANPNHSVHLLKWENHTFIYQCSQGELSRLRQYAQPISVKKLPNTPVIISAEPGMGKSTYLSSWLRTLKNDSHTTWVVKVNLLARENQLKEASFQEIKDVITFFMQGKSRFAHKMFAHRLPTDSITIFLDGFDEIQSRQQAKVIQLLKILKTTKVKIVVATRQHMQEILEDALSTFSYRLVPFDDKHRLKFFTLFWRHKFGLTPIAQAEVDDYRKEELVDGEKYHFIAKVDNYRKQLVAFFEGSINDEKRQFIGIPLQLELLATVFLEDFEKFYREKKKEPNFPVNFSLHKLYQRFIEVKYEILFKDKNTIGSFEQFRLFTRKLEEGLNHDHQRLAFRELFHHPDDTSDIIVDDIDMELVKAAGIVKVVGGKPEFVHLTFAEYFVAQLLVKRLQKPSMHSSHLDSKDFLIRHIFKENNSIIRTFIEELISTDDSLVEIWRRICARQLFSTRNSLPLLNHTPPGLFDHIPVASLEEKVESWLSIITNSMEVDEGRVKEIANALIALAGTISFWTQYNAQLGYKILQFFLKLKSHPISTKSYRLEMMGWDIHIKKYMLNMLSMVLWRYISACYSEKKDVDWKLIESFRSLPADDPLPEGVAKYISEIVDLKEYLNPLNPSSLDNPVALLYKISIESFIAFWSIRQFNFSEEKFPNKAIENYFNQVFCLFSDEDFIKNGAAIILACKVLTPVMADLLKKSEYVDLLWRDLLKPLLMEKTLNSRIDKFALIELCHIAINRNYQNVSKIRYDFLSKELVRHLFELIEDVLNAESEPNKLTVAYCTKLLHTLCQMGLQLIDTGNTLLFQTPSWHEFEYELRLTYDYQLIKESLLSMFNLEIVKEKVSKGKRSPHSVDHTDTEEYEPVSKKPKLEEEN